MSTVRIREITREQLREIEALTGAGPTEALARAVDSFRRSIIFADTDIAYAAIRSDACSAGELAEEMSDLEETLSDGLNEADWRA